jgi:hypothetical protein
LRKYKVSSPKFAFAEILNERPELRTSHMRPVGTELRNFSKTRMQEGEEGEEDEEKESELETHREREKIGRGSA